MRVIMITAMVCGAIGLNQLDAQPTPLLGEVSDNQYHAPTGEYAINLPVQPDLGGTITDTREVVTFQDGISLHASIACFSLNSAQKREEQTRGRRDYLIWFFRNQVQTQFQKRFEQATTESARFIPEMLDGSLMAFSLLPGGSMFGERIPAPHDGSLPTAKRGNLLFLHHDHLYVVSLELAKLLLDESIGQLTDEEQNEILRQRLVDLIARITFKVPFN